MDLGLNWIDLVIIITLLVFVIEAFGRSLVIETLDFVSFLLAFFLSFSYYNFAAKFFETQFDIPRSLSQVIGFMALWFLTETVFYLIARAVLPKIPQIKILKLNYFSVVPAFLKGLMNSEGHRANILSTDFGKIGIGVIDGGVYGLMFTQVFSY